MSTTLEEEIKKVEEEFENKWPNLETWNEHFSLPGNAKNAVKAFLRSSLTSIYEKGAQDTEKKHAEQCAVARKWLDEYSESLRK